MGADERDGEKSQSAPGGDDADDHGRRARAGRLRGVHDGGERHHRERDVGHVEEKRAQEGILDRLADQRERQDADEIGRGRHDEKI